MINYWKQLLEKYSSKGILIDTNILLLWLVGMVNPDRIDKFKPTNTFIPKDYNTLLKVISNFQKIVTTPNILTEVNSLTNQLGEPERGKCLSILAQKITKLNEVYLQSKEVSKNNKFAKFGLTDCGIIELSIPQKYLVLTDDFKLANYLGRLEIDVINFNNLRPYGWN